MVKKCSLSDLAFSCDICVCHVEEAMEASVLPLGGDVIKAAGGWPCSGPAYNEGQCIPSLQCCALQPRLS